MHKPITMETFVELVGRMDAQPFRRHSNGSSWLLPDGRIASEMWNGKEWVWRITEAA